MRRSMSLASQQEVPAYEAEPNINSYVADVGGRRASEANYMNSARYDRSKNVRI